MNRPWSGDHERTIDIKPLPRRDASGNRILPVAELLSERYFYLVWDFHQALFARGGGVLIDQQSHFSGRPAQLYPVR